MRNVKIAINRKKNKSGNPPHKLAANITSKSANLVRPDGTIFLLLLRVYKLNSNGLEIACPAVYLIRSDKDIKTRPVGRADGRGGRSPRTSNKCSVICDS